MKAVCKVLVLALVLGLALSALAANANSGTIVLRNEATVNGTKLPAGEYKVTLEGTGKEVKVNFMQNNKVVASSSGKIVDGTTAPEFSAVVMDKVNGANVIQEVRLAKLKGLVLLTK